MSMTFGKLNKGTQNQLQDNLKLLLTVYIVQLCTLQCKLKFHQLPIDTNTFKNHVDSHEHRRNEEI